MGDFLHKLISERRSLRNVLLALLEDSETHRHLREVLQSVPADSVSLTREDRWTLEKLFDTSNGRLQLATISAFCLLVQAHRGQLDADRLKEPVGLDPLCVLLTADMFGLPLCEETWKELWQWRAGVPPLTKLREQATDPVLTDLVERLGELRVRRSALDVLEHLAQDAGSRRVEAVVRELRPRRPSGHFRVNDEQQALVALLEGQGHAVNPHTMMALCLYVDIEAGCMGPRELETLLHQGETLDTSIYAMVAAARAFGIELTGLAVEDYLPGEPPDFLGELAQGSHGGVLACFRKAGSEGRWWERIGSREEAARALEWDLEFTGLVLATLHTSPSGDSPRWIQRLGEGAHLVGRFREETEGGAVFLWRRLRAPEDLREGFLGQFLLGVDASEPLASSHFPATLRELDDHLLLSWSPALSVQYLLLLRLRHSLQAAVHPHPRLSLRAHPEIFQGLLHYLSTVAPMQLQGLIHPDTLAGIVRALSVDQTLDFLIYEPLALALRRYPDADWLALPVLYELCEEDTVRLRGTLKQYDGRRMRTLINQRMYEILEQPDPHLRQAAAEIMSTRQGVGDRNARILIEDELSTRLSDPDPAVARSVCDGLVRLALSEHMPLPQLLEVGASMLSSSDQESRLEQARVEQYLDNIGEWVEEQRAKDELEPLTLPFTDQDGHLVAERARPIAELLASLLQASLLDGTLGEHRYFGVLPGREVRALGRALVESWRYLARAERKALAELVQSADTDRLLLEHRLLVDEMNETLARQFGEWPFLGGPGRAVTLFHLPPGETASPWRLEPARPGRPARRYTAELFRELITLMRRDVDLHDLRLFRLAQGGPGVTLVTPATMQQEGRFERREERTLPPPTPVRGLDVQEPVFTTERRFELSSMQLLQLHQARFVPLVMELYDFVPTELDEEDQQTMAALLSLYQSGRHGLLWEAACRRQTSGMHSHERPQRLQLGPEQREVLAARLQQKFSLSPQVLPVLRRMFELLVPEESSPMEAAV